MLRVEPFARVEKRVFPFHQLQHCSADCKAQAAYGNSDYERRYHKILITAEEQKC